jgi:hypothetical protein
MQGMLSWRPLIIQDKVEMHTWFLPNIWDSHYIKPCAWSETSLILSHVGYVTQQITSHTFILTHSNTNGITSTVFCSGSLPTVSDRGWIPNVSFICVINSAYIGVMRTWYQTPFLTVLFPLFRQSIVSQQAQQTLCCSSPGKHIHCFGILYATAHCCCTFG